MKSLCKTKKSLHKTATTKARADNEDMGEMASSIIASSHHPLLHVDQGTPQKRAPPVAPGTPNKVPRLQDVIVIDENGETCVEHPSCGHGAMNPKVTKLSACPVIDKGAFIFDINRINIDNFGLLGAEPTAPGSRARWANQLLFKFHRNEMLQKVYDPSKLMAPSDGFASEFAPGAGPKIYGNLLCLLRVPNAEKVFKNPDTAFTTFIKECEAYPYASSNKFDIFDAETATAATNPAAYPAMRFTLKSVKEPKFQQHMAELLQQVSYFKQHASALGWSGEDLPTRDTVPCLITNCYTNLYNGLPQIEAQSGGKWKGTYYESSKV